MVYMVTSYQGAGADVIVVGVQMVANCAKTQLTGCSAGCNTTIVIKNYLL